MIKLLLLSYHSLPMDVVASYRTKAFCDYLFENGIFPTLITHRWDRDENQWQYHESNAEIIVEEYENHKIVRLPRLRQQKSNKILTFFNLLRGNLDIELINNYKIYRKYLFEHLQLHHYDLMLAIYSPHYHLKLAFEINKRFKLPYILDFRDLWDNQVITKSYKPSLKKLLLDSLIKYYWRKWLKHAVFFTTTGTKWKNFLENLSSNNGHVVPNGCDIRIEAKFKKPETFTISYFGRIYPYQNIELIIEGILKFISKCSNCNIKVQLIGVKKSGNFDGVTVFKNIPNIYLEIIDYLPKNELIEYCSNNTSIFILPNLKEDNGSFFVKLFDYISINKPVILAPENGSDNDKLVKLLGIGLVSSSVSEIVDFLEHQYSLFINNKDSSVFIDQKEVDKLSRKSQVLKFSKIVHDKYNHAVL